MLNYQSYVKKKFKGECNNKIKEATFYTYIKHKQETGWQEEVVRKQIDFKYKIEETIKGDMFINLFGQSI